MKENLTFIFVGLIIKRKRPHWLLQSAQRLLDEYNGINFLFIGHDPQSGTFQDSFLKQMGKLNLTNVSYLGYRDDVDKILPLSNVLVLPSVKKGEAFPRVILEAFASGVPVVASSVAGIPEIVDDGVNGYLFEPHSFSDFHECIASVVKNPTVLSAMSQSARRTAVKKFSLKDSGPRLKQIYLNLYEDRAEQ